MTDIPDPTEANRRSWNFATRQHNRHKRDQAGFLRRGGSTLFSDEVELLEPLAGERLLHLLCNSGQDTLSLAARGAEVTGVDLSDEAIAFARKLSLASGIPGRFERADVFDFLARAEAAGERWDTVFLSYGALPWIADLDRFFRGVAAVLDRRGRVVIVEFHPLALCLDEARRLQRSYFSAGDPVLEAAGVEDYVAASDGALAPSGTVPGVDEEANPHPAYEYVWTLAQVVQAMLDAGLALESLQEMPYSNGWKIFEDLHPMGAARFAPRRGEPQLPLMFAAVAREPGR